jgi:hypothetical protein
VIALPRNRLDWFDCQTPGANPKSRSTKLLNLGNRLCFLVWHPHLCRGVPDVEA